MAAPRPELRDIFCTALDYSNPQEQAAYLDQVCQGQPDLRARVETLLRAHAQADNFLLTETDIHRKEAVAEEGLPRIPGYEVLGLLGSGGMGKVYKARQLALNRLVALKMILSGAHAQPEELARFRTEAEAGARLQHPNIVQIYEVGEHEGIPFLALEYVAGGSLGQRLRGQTLPPRQAAELLATLAEAVHHAHLHGVVHRDLKPANVLLMRAEERGSANARDTPLPTPHPKIADFGLAKKLDEIGPTQTGAVLGTPNYMAPEQASGRSKDIGPATDVYALGAILYEVLTGRPPFVAANLILILEMVRAQDPVPLRHLEPKVPRSLELICLKCLSKEPQRRYPSARALADDLGRYLNGEWIAAREESVVSRLTQMLDRSQPIGQLQGPGQIYLWVLLQLPFVANLLLFLNARYERFYPVAALVVFSLACLLMMAGVYLLQARRTIVQLAQLRRQLWALRLGALGATVTTIPVNYLLTSPGEPWNVLTLFPMWTILVGLLFFVVGGFFWGRLYLVGLVCFLAALLMPLYLELAPVVLGLLLSGTFNLIARKAQAINQEQEDQ